MVVPVFVEGDTEEFLIKRKLAGYLHEKGATKSVRVYNQGGAQKLISKIDKLVERALEDGADAVFVCSITIKARSGFRRARMSVWTGR